VKMRFTINDGYEGVSGLVNCGKLVINLATDVVDGVYESAVPVVQQTLSELRGGNGRVFSAVIVKADGTTSPVDLEPIPAKMPTRSSTEAALEMEHKVQATPGATGPNLGTGYSALPESELKLMIQAKGLPIPDNAQKAELVEILAQSE
jgi:hypothetical protein